MSPSKKQHSKADKEASTSTNKNDTTKEDSSSHNTPFGTNSECSQLSEEEAEVSKVKENDTDEGCSKSEDDVEICEEGSPPYNPVSPAYCPEHYSYCEVTPPCSPNSCNYTNIRPISVIRNRDMNSCDSRMETLTPSPSDYSPSINWLAGHAQEEIRSPERSNDSWSSWPRSPSHHHVVPNVPPVSPLPSPTSGNRPESPCDYDTGYQIPSPVIVREGGDLNKSLVYCTLTANYSTSPPPTNSPTHTNSLSTQAQPYASPIYSTPYYSSSPPTNSSTSTNSIPSITHPYASPDRLLTLHNYDRGLLYSPTLEDYPSTLQDYRSISPAYFPLPNSNVPSPYPPETPNHCPASSSEGSRSPNFIPTSPDRSN